VEEKTRLIRFVFARVVVVSLFLLSTTILDIRESARVTESALTGITWLVVATYIVSVLVVLVLWRFDRFNRPLTYLLIIWDLGFVTLLLLFSGGISSPYTFLYLLTIISASVLLSRREALYGASLCAILYGAIMDLHYFGRLTSLGLYSDSARHLEPSALFFIILVNIVAFFITALLTGYLADRLRISESALRRQAMNLEELERLNTLIVSHLNSGLLTITPDGKIRVFNRYAEQLTGVSQSVAYDRPLQEVIPGFAPFMDRIAGISREEIVHSAPDGSDLVFGFKSISFTDKEGTPLGVIIDFQDLTQLKKMQAELERADRLAAIGELSARIAHEIRNPLAAISGSVQLIAGDTAIAPQDRRLLDIVLRETARLNKLIKDFLAYARPTQPVKTRFHLWRLITEVRELLAKDPRFNAVTILTSCPEDISLYADGDQFRQVLWNLLVNAAEAMAGHGTITVSAANSPLAAFSGAGLPVIITVADTGAGIAGEDLKKLFEPFRSSKPGGTGLGLATVYRIVEAHGGTIRVSSTEGQGAEFTIALPEH
jgi:two-component system, NtrC family, sensor histidine kinase PilS